MKTHLTVEEKEFLKDNSEMAYVSTKLMGLIIEANIEKLLKVSIDDGDGAKLLIARAKIDGMKEMMRENEQYIAKIIKS